MDQKSKESDSNGSVAHTNNIYCIGNEGNQIEIDYLGHGKYRLICRDHFSQNFVDYYVDRKELGGLTDFLKGYTNEKQ